MPGLAVVGADIEGHDQHIAEVDPERLDEVLQQEERRAQQQHADHDEPGERQIDVGQPLDAGTDAAHHGQRRQERDHHDQDDEQGQVGPIDDADRLHPRRDLLHAEAQGRRDAEKGAEDREHVDEVAHPALHPVAEDRLEGPADRHRPPRRWIA